MLDKNRARNIGKVTPLRIVSETCLGLEMRDTYSAANSPKGAAYDAILDMPEVNCNAWGYKPAMPKPPGTEAHPSRTRIKAAIRIAIPSLSVNIANLALVRTLWRPVKNRNNSSAAAIIPVLKGLSALDMDEAHNVRTASNLAIQRNRNSTQQKRTASVGIVPIESSRRLRTGRLVARTARAGPMKKRSVIKPAATHITVASTASDPNPATSRPCTSKNAKLRNTVAKIIAAQRQSIGVDLPPESLSKKRTRHTISSTPYVACGS